MRTYSRATAGSLIDQLATPDGPRVLSDWLAESGRQLVITSEHRPPRDGRPQVALSLWLPA